MIFDLEQCCASHPSQYYILFYFFKVAWFLDLNKVDNYLYLVIVTN